MQFKIYIFHEKIIGQTISSQYSLKYFKNDLYSSNKQKIVQMSKKNISNEQKK